jgi:hypothetical protein
MRTLRPPRWSGRRGGAGAPSRAHHQGMRGRWLTLGGAAVALVWAATAAGQARYWKTDEPPPRGTPSPRLGEMPRPSPARASEGSEENEQRFPIGEYQFRREREQRAQQATTGRVEVVGQNAAEACQGLSAEERIECPLNDPGDVLSIVDTPQGVRVTLKPGTGTPERWRQRLACQRNLTQTRPQTPACSFYDARTEHDVGVENGQVMVELRRREDAAGLREQVRTALQPRRDVNP